MMTGDFLAPIRQRVVADAPQLASLFDVMAGEARFARWWLTDELELLPRNASVLEVGGGSFLLACQLAREGYSITSIEPMGTGFDELGQLGQIVLEAASRECSPPRVVRCRAEDFTATDQVDFAFSVNVMEHVDSPEAVICRVAESLPKGGAYRFLCPNYLFPYEPHFNLPTLGTKKLTERMLRARIMADTRTGDPVGVWNSLNWITVPSVRRIAAKHPSLAVDFRRGTLEAMLERSIHDPEFARRRSPWMVSLVRAMKATGILRCTSLVPATIQPMMDARIKRV